MAPAVTRTPEPSTTPANFEDWKPGAIKSWQPAAFPDGTGGTWTWAEPAAQVETKGGWIELNVPKFTRNHSAVQIFDNPKHLLACGRQIPVTNKGLCVEVEIAGQITKAPDQSWNTGFASFNLMDFAGGYVLDGLVNSTRTAVLFERLFIPGMIPLENSWTTIADGPGSKPMQTHTYKFEIDPVAKTINAWIDGVHVLDHRNAPAIASFTPGFGLITLEPIRNGKSVSNKGQGGTGRLGAIRISTLR
jgi:hypothetical protein